MTEGIGLPLEDLWTKKLHSMICKELNQEIPYWSIASGGTGLDHMTRYLYNLKDLLRPQIIICYIPSSVRRERWHEDRWSVWSLEREKDTDFLTNEQLVNYQTEKNLVMINLMCEEIDAHFLYSRQFEEYKVENLNLSNFIYKELFIMQLDLARDNMHAGPKSNELFANTAFEIFWPNISEKLGLT